MQSPFYQDEEVVLYHGEAMEIMPHLNNISAIITDPPYGETSLEWDKWPTGWPATALEIAPQMWCFGSMGMFLDKVLEFKGWKHAQEIVWEKHNGSNSSSDRFRRVHELAIHLYQGKWGSLFKQVQYTNDALAKKVKRKAQIQHWGSIDRSEYVSTEGGPRLMRSVIYAKSCHGYAVNETQKPEAIVEPLLRYSVPIGGTVLDCFAGSGTTLAVAKKNGRKAIGIEKRLGQCQLIVDRLRQIVK